MVEQMKQSSETREQRDSVSVSGEVTYVNENIDLPFDLKEGETSNLALFLIDNKATEGVLQLGIDARHGRSSALGRIKILSRVRVEEEEFTVVYNDVDLKGNGYVGYTKDGAGVLPLRLFQPLISDQTAGLWDKKGAELEKNILEELTNVGSRSPRIAAIIKLNEVVMPDGTKISTSEAKKLGFIKWKINPVIGVRLFRYRERVEHNSKKSKAIFERGKHVIEEELKKKLTWNDYIEWFAKTLGKEIALMHNINIRSGAIRPDNVTLACEILDHEGGQYLSKFDDDQQRRYMMYDVQQGQNVLGRLMTILKHSGIPFEDLPSDIVDDDDFVKERQYEIRIADLLTTEYGKNRIVKH